MYECLLFGTGRPAINVSLKGIFTNFARLIMKDDKFAIIFAYRRFVVLRNMSFKIITDNGNSQSNVISGLIITSLGLNILMLN